jgi:glycosyltransferase involved in cell wall biosynthesis
MLAIIIPYYKLYFFEQTLQSLVNQTDKRFNLYIGNDASPENPKSLLEKYKDKLVFSYQEFSNNLGSKALIKQWHRCLDLTKDEKWVIFLGDDDYLSPNAVEEFYKNQEAIQISNVLVVRLSLIKIDDKGNVLAKPHIHPVIEKSTDFIVRRRKTSLSEYIFDKNKLEKIKFKDFPSALFSDIVAILEVSNYSNIYSLNDANVYVRISESNISGYSIDLEKHFQAEKLYYLHLLENFNYFDASQKRFIFDRVTSQILKNFKKDIIFITKIMTYYVKYSINDFVDLMFKLTKSLIKTNLK